MKIKTLITKDSNNVNIRKFTVLVGPNNVGKSQTLRDIQSRMTMGASVKTTIIDKIEFEKPSSYKELLKGLKETEDPNNVEQSFFSGIHSDLVSGSKMPVNLTAFENEFKTQPNLDFVLGNISRYRVSFLDASSRLIVAKEAESYNPQTDVPQNLLQVLFGSDPDANVEGKLREAFKEAFGTDIKLDYSGMRRFTFRVAREFEKVSEDPRKAFRVMSKYYQLDKQGDGFRSFVGVVLSLLLSEGRVILLDEPEAFLHPAQAKLLGKWVADQAQNTLSQIIVATHNANFLYGILSSNQDVDIYRLNREGNKTTYTHIESDATAKLAKSPLLSSQRVLEAIFYKGVVVCEAESDRCLYQTVAAGSLGNQSILFIHAHNKQTIKNVVGLLRKAEIPTCAIADIDIMNSESNLKELLVALSGDSISDSVLQMRKKVAVSIDSTSESVILDKLKEKTEKLLEQLNAKKHNLDGARGALSRIRKESSKWSNVKNKGIKGIPLKEQDIAKNLIEEAKNYGLFIVPVGELESWLDLGTRKKNKWIVLALDALHKSKCSDELKSFVKAILAHMDKKHQKILL